MLKRKDFWLSRLASRDIKVEEGRIELIDETAQEKKRHITRRHLAIFALPLLLILIISWVIAGFYLPKSRISNTVVSLRQPDGELQELISNSASNYRLSIVYPDGTKKTFSLDDIGIFVDNKASITSIREKQHSLVNRVQWWHPMTAYAKITIDDGRLNNFLSEEATRTIQPAQDATISIKDGRVQLSDSVAGKHYGLIDPVVTMSDSASRLKSGTLKLQTLSTRPAITSKQLASSQTRLKQILGQKVVFTIDDKKIQATPSDIAEWLELTPKNSGHSIDITVNSGKILAYINKIAASYIHPPKAQIQVIDTSGVPSVLINGVNGTDVVNKSDAASQVSQNILRGKSVSQTLEVKFSAYKTVTAQSYPKWIEVDTTNKRMYAYEQSNLMRTFLVSAGAPRTPTVTGQFAIYSKYVQQDMRGRNVDGSSYFQPKVPWINYFYADYAIHGNYWRPLSYFGYINSSHGCVGVIESDAQWIYTWAPIGTPVIVHS